MIKGQLPKGVQYTKTLLNYDPERTIPGRIKQRIVGSKTKEHAKKEWYRILGSHDKNQNTRDYIDHLIENNALQLEKKEGKPPNETEYYSLNKQRLRELYRESWWFKAQEDLIFETIDKAVSGKRIANDY